MAFVKKNDKLISLCIVLLTVVLIFIVSREFFLSFATEYKLIGGFIKFFFLATIGDFIGLRLKLKYWSIPKNILLKATVWGLIGMVIVMMFIIFPKGVKELQLMNILPFESSVVATAFFTSAIMNIIFAPTMMVFHRISDTYLDGAKSITDAINKVDWANFFHKIILLTIPLFWIPAHTVTFLLPREYQVIMAAVLGIFLGLLLGIFKK